MLLLLFCPEEAGVEGKSAPKDAKCHIDLKHACLQLRLGRRMVQLSALSLDSVRPACCPLHPGVGGGPRRGLCLPGDGGRLDAAFLYGFFQLCPVLMSICVSSFMTVWGGEEQTVRFGSGCWLMGVFVQASNAGNRSCIPELHHCTPLMGIQPGGRSLWGSQHCHCLAMPLLWTSPVVNSDLVPSITPWLACQNQLHALRAVGA